MFCYKKWRTSTSKQLALLVKGDLCATQKMERDNSISIEGIDLTMKAIRVMAVLLIMSNLTYTPRW